MKKRLRKKLYNSPRKWKYQHNLPFLRKITQEFGERWMQWGLTLKPGDVIEDCRYRAITIQKIELEPGDFRVVATDGFACSLTNCCGPVGPDTIFDENLCKCACMQNYRKDSEEEIEKHKNCWD